MDRELNFVFYKFAIECKFNISYLFFYTILQQSFKFIYLQSYIKLNNSELLNTKLKS